MCLNSWNISFMHNDMKDFIFRLRNNQLLTNDRLHAIDGLHNAACTFCKIRGVSGADPESFAHIFLNCLVTIDFLRQWCSQMKPAPDLDSADGRNFFWYGTLNRENLENDSKYINFLFDCFRFLIWKFRCRKRVPNYPAFKRELDFLIFNTLRGSQSFYRKIMNINLCSNLIPARG